MGNEILIKHEVTDGFLLDILTNTVESGCLGYWGYYNHTLRDMDNLNVTEFQIADAEDVQDATDAGRTGLEIENDKDLWSVVDKAVILKGLQLVLSGEVGISSDVLNYIVRGVSEDDAGDIDAIACDCIVQAALFGELVYG